MSDVEDILQETETLLARLEVLYGQLAEHEAYPEAVIQYDMDAHAAKHQRQLITAQRALRRKRKQR